MSLLRALNILSAVLGTTGTTLVAITWSLMAIAIWASTREQITVPVSMGVSKEAAAAASLSAIDRKDAGALYETYGAAASSTCDGGAEDYIRSVAKNDFRWAESGSGLFGTKFSKLQEMVSQPGVITLSTDKLILGNGSQPDTQGTLYCRYDTQTRKVLGYEIGQQ